MSEDTAVVEETAPEAPISRQRGKKHRVGFRSRSKRIEGHLQALGTDGEARPVGMSELVAALRALTGDSDDLIKKKAEADALAMKRVMRPENEQAPGISVYSHPEGDLAHPKDALICQMFWVGYPESVSTLTPEEVRLFNVLARQIGLAGFHDSNPQGQPCKKYRCTKTDGSELDIEVRGLTGTNGLSRLEVYFPCRGEHRHNLPSKVNMLRQMVGEMDSDRSADLAEIARLRKELAALSR